MSTSTNPLAAGVPALQPPSPTQTMLAPDGTPGEIPVEHVQDAVKGGFKLGMPMTAPDGTTGTIPVDQAHAAVKAGFKPSGITTTAAPETYGAGLKKAGRDIYGVASNLAPNTNTQAGQGVSGKILGTAEDVAQGIDNLAGVTTLTDTVKNGWHAIDAYEKARTSGASITDALKAANERAAQADAIIPAIKQRGREWVANPGPETVRALGDVLATAATAYGLHKIVAPPVADALGVTPGEPAAAATAPEAAPAAADAVGSPSWLQRMNPFRTGGPLSRAVSPTAAAQPEAQATLRTGATASATDAGVTAPVTATPGAGIRTLMEKPIAEATKIEDGLYANVNKAAETDMKSLYDRQEELQDAIDDPTNVHQKPALQAELKTNQADIATGEAKVQAKLGADAPKLISQAKAATQQRFAMETGDAKLFNNESVVKGNVAYGSNETINVDAAIRQAEILDKPSKFAPRGTPSRLQQMFGEQGAKDFKQGLYDAQKSGKTVVNRNDFLKLLGVGGGVLEGIHLFTK